MKVLLGSACLLLIECTPRALLVIDVVEVPKQFTALRAPQGIPARRGVRATGYGHDGPLFRQRGLVRFRNWRFRDSALSVRPSRTFTARLPNIAVVLRRSWRGVRTSMDFGAC
jgi:hypothetical protein